MKSPKRIYMFHLMKIVIILVAFLIPPQYLRAQTYQQDTATINRLLIAAKAKRFSDTVGGIRLANQALGLARKYKDAFWIRECFHRLGRIHEVNNQDKKAFPYFIAQLEVEDLLNGVDKNILYLEVARAYRENADYLSAYKYLTKSYDLGIMLTNDTIQQSSNLELGLFYDNMNDFEKATQYITKSIELAVKMNNPDEVCDGYRSLANIYLKSKHLELALISSEKSVSYVEKIDNYTFPQYFVYLAHARVLKACEKYDESISVLEKALALCQAVGDKATIANVSTLLASVYVEINDFKNAENYYKKAADFMSESSDVDVMDFNYGFGRFLLKKGEYDGAISCFQKSINIAARFGKKAALQRAYERISEALELKEDHRQSLVFVRKALVIRDSIFSEENTKRIAEAQFKFDVAQSEQEVKRVKNRQFYILFVSIFIVLCLFIAFLFYFLRSKTQKNKFLLEKTEMLTETTRIIEAKNKQLEESNEVLRQFAFASAHDLKEPLRSINSFVNIIQKRYIKILPPEAAEYMGFVTVGVKRMESLLNALLEFSSVLIDDNTAHKDNDIALVLTDVFQHCEGLMNEKNAVIRYPSVFPTILMNEAHLKPILFNLVHNALKFSKEQAKIEIGFQTTSDDFILFVKDEGIGMDKNYSDKIFKLFQRLDRVAHKESVGIGLTICKKIVDKYAGRIWFESVVKEGTTFYIAFPKSMISEMPSLLTPPQYLEVKAAVLEANLSV
jgi:signal transduction histidine kinase